MQVQTDKITSSSLRCNTSLQPLITPTPAKADMFYTSEYCSKDPFELSNTSSFFHQAQIAMRNTGQRRLMQVVHLLMPKVFCRKN